MKGIGEESRSTSLAFQRRSRNLRRRRYWLGRGGFRGSSGDEGNEGTRICGAWGEGRRCSLGRGVVLATCGVCSWLERVTQHMCFHLLRADAGLLVS